jgi:DNA-binding NarL/FixJ family response regulator
MRDAEVDVLLVEDDAMVRGWVRLSLRNSEFRIAGEAEEAAAAHELCASRGPDLLLVDYRLPDRLGTELIRDLRRDGVLTPAILMTANGEQGMNEAAREAGAQGTVLKTGKAEELLLALRLVCCGGDSFDGRHPRRKQEEAALSPREREVIKLVASGATNREIGELLGIGAESVKTLVARSFAKLGVHRRAEAVAAAHARGLL